jgi:hypothetical protein
MANAWTNAMVNQQSAQEDTSTAQEEVVMTQRINADKPAD